MPDLNLPPYKKIVTDLPVLDHTIVVVDKNEIWEKRLNSEKYETTLFKIKNCYQITRKKLLTYKYKNQEEKCIDILLWGYPRGGRGHNISLAISKISKVSKVASHKNQTWEKYLKGFKGTGVGVATASKFAYFYKLEFEGQKALILDQQIADVLESGVWGKKLSAVGKYSEWSNRYVKYLSEMNALAGNIGCTGDQLELALYLFGKAFR